MPGWKQSTKGITSFDALPDGAKAYIKTIEELLKVPVDIVSTGPGREEIIVRKKHF